MTPIQTYGALTLVLFCVAFGPGQLAAQTPGPPAYHPAEALDQFDPRGLLLHDLAMQSIYGLRQVESVPAGAELKAFQLRKERGVELVSLYRKAAPAVVAIFASDGLGSGFLINKEGWLVSNHHVAKRGTLQDNLTRVVTVRFGKLSSEGNMQLLDGRYTAEVYKWDVVRDLALLKLKDMPYKGGAGSEVPMIGLADKSVSPGDDVAAIGNAGVTLLWSLKPGEVQAVGRRLFDNAEFIQMLEAKSARLLKGSPGQDFEKELKSGLEAFGSVMVVQASCPTLHGDSGGPLLNMDGKAVGICAFGLTDSGGHGTAHYFIHAKEIRDFLNGPPTVPMSSLPSLWEAEFTVPRLRDWDTNGKPETLACLKLERTPSGFRTNAVAFGWNLKEDFDLKPYFKSTGGTQPKRYIDYPALWEAKALRFQIYGLIDNNSILYAYDLNDDGHFERVRIDRDGDGNAVSELRSEGPGKPYQAAELKGKQRVLLDATEIPESWRERYEKVIRRLQVAQAP